MDVTHTQAVRARLAALGVSQHALARALGISQATLSLWLNGYRQPPTGFEAEAAAALDLLEQAERAATEARAQVLAVRVCRAFPPPSVATTSGIVGMRPPQHHENASVSDSRCGQLAARQSVDATLGKSGIGPMRDGL